MSSNRCCNNFITTNSFNNNFDDDAADALNNRNYANPNRVLSANNYANSAMRYGSSYVPVQTFRTVYSPANGLMYGTMFPELVRTYMPNQSLSEMEYLRNYNERGCRG